MRHESAVSEVIGAVLLIGVVMTSMIIIGVIMLSSPPPEKIPKASITTYCVQCDLNDPPTYDVMIYHGGGESLKQDMVKFFLLTEDGNLNELSLDKWEEYNLFNNAIIFDYTPYDCMKGDTLASSTEKNQQWGDSEFWYSGQTLRLRFPSESEPEMIEIRYYPFNSPMIRANFKDQIKLSPCVNMNSPDECYVTGEIMPIFLAKGKNPDGSCWAEFTYNMTHEPLTIPVHKTGDIPWNNFQGSDTTGTVKDFSSFTSGGSENYIEKVNFSTNVQWWLGRTKSVKVKCE